jgi:transposase
MIKAHAQSQLSRTKTDKVDAALIADFCATKHPSPWQPPPAEAHELQALVRRLESLQEMRQMETNRLEEGLPSERVAASLRQTITFLDQQIAATQESIEEHINSHPDLCQQRDLLISIPGIGETTAAKLLGEVLDIKLYKGARQLAAFAGLAPRLHESGTSVKKKAKMSKTGAPRLRKALYFPAISALKYNPSIRRMGERLRLRGKCPMQVIGAAMRKLIHLAYGVLKSGQPFVSDWARKTA